MNEDEDFLTDPLVGLCSKPAHLMSEDEMRQQVILIRQLSQSFQTLKSEVEAAEAPKLRNTKARTTKKATAEDIDNLLL